MRISDWSSDVCSSDLDEQGAAFIEALQRRARLDAGEDDPVAGAREQVAGIVAFVIGRTGNDQFRAAVRPLIRLDQIMQSLFGNQPRDRQDEIVRSEEHTSELQSLMRNSYAVFCLKKKKQT